MIANIKAIIKKIISIFCKNKSAPESTWQLFNSNIQLDPSVIIGHMSSIEIVGNPKEYGVCVQIGEESQFFGHMVLQKPGSKITIGKRTQIGASHLIASTEIKIGDDVLMAWGITVIDNDSHSIDWKHRKNDVLEFGHGYRKNPQHPYANKNWDNVGKAPIIIGNKSWIGFGVSILKGVSIGEGAVIGSGSVVTKNIPSFCVAVGNPAKVIRKIE